MASLTLRQTREVSAGGYKVTNAVISATGIPEEVFVFSLAGVYSHIASVRELETLPVTADPRVPWYRQASCYYEFSVLDDAVDYAANTKSSLGTLVIEYATAETAFVGTEDTIISS